VEENSVSAYLFPTINCLAFVAYSGARIVLGRYYVTGQPSSPAYPALAAAGIKSVVCVRQPGEPAVPPPVPPPPPFDTQEAAELGKLGVSYRNIPITREMTQPQFDTAATQAAVAVLNNGAQGPALIHCSTGDRASSVFAVLLVLAAGFKNPDAADYASNCLLLANPNMIELVLGYRPPQAVADQIREAATSFPKA
jgi:protein tyrosine phosphatase (PTP) superfamily phosphohydrolase (DUF442 family)